MCIALVSASITKTLSDGSKDLMGYPVLCALSCPSSPRSIAASPAKDVSRRECSFSRLSLRAEKLGSFDVLVAFGLVRRYLLSCVKAVKLSACHRPCAGKCELSIIRSKGPESTWYIRASSRGGFRAGIQGTSQWRTKMTDLMSDGFVEAKRVYVAH